MFGETKKASSEIGDYSNNNAVFQNCSFDKSIININTNSETVLNVLKETHSYSAIQQMVTQQLEAVKTIHPLFPDFSATFDSRLKKLISTPETLDALKKYPKKVKGAFKFDYSKFPNMSEEETPWDYAYRTQQKIKFPTTAYQEYLGDVEDPFPTMEYQEGMVTVISPPEFPPAIEAQLECGGKSIAIMIRRVAVMEYNKICFKNVSKGDPIDITCIIDTETRETDFTLTRKYDCSLKKQLLREELLSEITSNPIIIRAEGLKILESKIVEKDIHQDFFIAISKYKLVIKYLLEIEKQLSCKFDTEIQVLENDECELIEVLYSSMQGKWYGKRMTFDKTIRVDYDKIPDDIGKENFGDDEISATNFSVSFMLLGVKMSADTHQIVYKNARINNIKSILKNIKKKKKSILITIKPQNGKDKFEKYSRLEGIKVEKQ